jgi:hypothetical protein
MAEIEKYTEGALAKTKKANEMIDAINRLLQMRFETIESSEPPEVEFSDNNVVLRIPEAPDLVNYSDFAVTMCVNGSPVSKVILVKDAT